MIVSNDALIFTDCLIICSCIVKYADVFSMKHAKCYVYIHGHIPFIHNVDCFLNKCFMYVYVCVSLCVCHMCVSIHRVQKMVFHSL